MIFDVESMLQEKSETGNKAQGEAPDSSTDTVTSRSRGYGDVTATYIRRSKISSHIYTKYQYM